MTNIGDKKITHIYKGNELITDSSKGTQSIRLGNNIVSFVYQGNELLYPNPIKEELKIHYDFKGKTNTSINNNVAEDLSVNGNNGFLNNFIFNDKGGYNNGLEFDGIDDYIELDTNVGKNFTISITIGIDNIANNYILSSTSTYFFIRKNGNHLDLSILNNGSRQELFRATNFFTEFLNNKLNITYVINSDSKDVILYTNGEIYNTFKMNEEAQNQMKITGLGIWNTNYFFKGYLYGVQVYNKYLTEGEVKHNYNLEKERWNL